MHVKFIRGWEMFVESRLNPIIRDYRGCDETRVTLCIYPENLNVEGVTKILRIEPTDARNKGHVHINSIGRRRVTPRNVWFLESEPNVQSKDMRHHLDWLIRQLDGREERLYQLQRMPGMKMTVRCVWWADGGDGPVLWPEQMAGIARFNLECAFDFKDYSGDDL